jgi:hypothetical protein
LPDEPTIELGQVDGPAERGQLEGIPLGGPIHLSIPETTNILLPEGAKIVP